ncbi:hypothetical protein Pelo_18621 [Pelomyxa schiedti]|nr:hypothetical protein Pelo_18621 [Pelomyxa schiedti]
MPTSILESWAARYTDPRWPLRIFVSDEDTKLARDTGVLDLDGAWIRLVEVAPEYKNDGSTVFFSLTRARRVFGVPLETAVSMLKNHFKQWCPGRLSIIPYGLNTYIHFKESEVPPVETRLGNRTIYRLPPVIYMTGQVELYPPPAPPPRQSVMPLPPLPQESFHSDEDMDKHSTCPPSYFPSEDNGVTEKVSDSVQPPAKQQSPQAPHLPPPFPVPWSPSESLPSASTATSFSSAAVNNMVAQVPPATVSNGTPG